MKVIIRGTRGSIPVASPETQRHGGNTTCIEVLTDAGDRIIIDAGSGIRTLGNELMATGPASFALCFTHAHWDHLLGFPMFAPIFAPGSRIAIHAPHDIGRDGIRSVLSGIMDRRYFPVTFDKLPARIDVHDFTPGESFRVGTALVETLATSHPGGNSAYRITADGWTFLFTGDHECGPGPVSEGVFDFLRGADVALVDAQYTDEEYAARQGWGHSTFSAWPERAAAAGVGWLLFSHHDPGRTDLQLDDIVQQVRTRFEHLPLDMDMAEEGMELSGPDSRSAVCLTRTCGSHGGAPHGSAPRGGDDVPGGSGFALFAWLNSFSRELARYKDVGVLLDRILLEGRTITQADAGTVFLVEEDRLTFANIHNDTLFPGSAANKHAYASTTLPLDTTSIAGYVAATRSMVNIRDMRNLPPGVPFSFNESLDLATGYRTVSTLTVPILGQGDRILGVMQLINSQPEGVPEAFTESMETRVQLLAGQAGGAIENGMLARAFILRMLNMAELRDPHETGPHVQRVGAYAAEIYHRWAERRGVDIDALRYEKSQLRLAAMLHDVGKVGIEDRILKKPGKLDPEEYAVMKTHSALGARIFTGTMTEVDRKAREVALHHHQKWDGSGYTGSDEPPLRGEDIPLAARITAVADVYDALCSKRSYKKAWTPDEALETIRQDAGTHFDPEIVDCFVDVKDVIAAIRARYPDEDPSL